MLSQPQYLTHSGDQRGFQQSCPIQVSVTHLSCSWVRVTVCPKAPSTSPPTPPPEPEETPVSWAVTAVFEVALDSCRCTCAGSQGLCGTEQTAPCSLGNSVTSQRCCKAESKGKQVRDVCHSKPATPTQTSTPSQGWVMGPGLTSFASSSSVSLLICHLQHHRICRAFGLCISTYTFLLPSFCLAGQNTSSSHQISLQSHTHTFFPRWNGTTGSSSA